MQMSGEVDLSADRDTVWTKLNDPDVLRECIPGCESLEQTADGEFVAVTKMKFGPIKASFKGAVKLTDVNPPKGYRIVGEGSGGAAGFAKGGAVVSLSELGPATTRLSYEVEASIGGKIAQLGGRLVNSVAKKYADEFFAKFEQAVNGAG